MKVLKTFHCVIMITLLLWLTLSWCDVVADNHIPDAVNHPWNLLTVNVGGVE